MGDIKRFVCEQNLMNFRKLLSDACDPSQRTVLERLFAEYNRELALLDAQEVGTEAVPSHRVKNRSADADALREGVLADFNQSAHPYLLIDPGPGLHIVDANSAYLAATFTERDSIAGRSLFDVFPDNPDQPLADGVKNLFLSLKTVAATRRPHAMAVQRYDVRDRNGDFVERHWLPINTPIQDGQGRLVYLLHHVEDVTEQVTAGRGKAC